MVTGYGRVSDCLTMLQRKGIASGDLSKGSSVTAVM